MWICPFLSFCENRFRLSRFVKNLNSTKRGASFLTFSRRQGDHYCTCAEKWCHLSYFSKTFQKIKIKKLRPKITKIASRGSCLKTSIIISKIFSHFTGKDVWLTAGFLCSVQLPVFLLCREKGEKSSSNDPDEFWQLVWGQEISSSTCS